MGAIEEVAGGVVWVTQGAEVEAEVVGVVCGVEGEARVVVAACGTGKGSRRRRVSDQIVEGAVGPSTSTTWVVEPFGGMV
jgi:hypothetical protein